MDGLDITATRTSSNRAGYSQTLPPRRLRSRLARHAKAIWFFIVVVLPTIAAATYLIGFAADQYVSEARFVVRGTSSQSPGILSGLLQTAGGVAGAG